jgi:hypothetical protein
MGLFDLFKPKSVKVPEGHAVTVHPPSTAPSVTRTEGGVVIASFGVAGDDDDRELDVILRGVQRAVEESPARAYLVEAAQAIKASALFAPSEPSFTRAEAPVVWVFHEGAAAAISRDARRLQLLLRCMHGLSKRAAGIQTAYFVEPRKITASALPLMQLVRGLGIEARGPLDSEPKAVLLEVHRPDKRILCAMPGKPFADLERDTFSRAANDARVNASDHERETMDARELAGLLTRNLQAREATPFVLRAPRLRRIILDELGEGLEPLIKELQSRTAPLFAHMTPSAGNETGSVQMRSLGERGNALPFFSDLACAHWAAEDMKKTSGSFTVGSMPARDLIRIAAQGKVGLAVCVYRDRKTPIYALIPADIVARLATSG